MNHSFSGQLKELIDYAKAGKKSDIDYIMNHLNSNTPFKITRFVDFALGNVHSQEGIKQIEYYLFNGSLIQRNYSSLYFNRRGNWKIVQEAYHMGLIDEIQAFAR